mmetsp:Transcript_16441/g.24596  ORF Transcript_16441/g.24596 Transcript_16441/m.24596 type:complete len:220 (+) Transcript_16441:394-1053(+)
MDLAVISFWVSVPVLSEATTVAHPSVSTDVNFFTIAFDRAILNTPSARVTVTQIGRPSGIAATARLTATVTVSKKGLPRRNPNNAIKAITMLLITANVLPSSSILTWRGLFLLSTLPNSFATFPNSVLFPTATTMALPRPEQTKVPMNAMFFCSVKGTSVLLDVNIDNPDPVLVIEVFSPVRELSSTVSSTVSTKRQSAGTRSPVLSKMESPTTRSCAG